MSRHRGFTLVEILIAVGILAIVAAIAVTAVVSLRGGSEVKAAESELSNVQEAVNVMMADQQIDNLAKPVKNATDDMSKFPDWVNNNAGGYVLYPGGINGSQAYKNSDSDKYIRQATTTGTYTAAKDGTVIQVTTGY